jgi:hypothetical protein
MVLAQLLIAKVRKKKEVCGRMVSSNNGFKSINDLNLKM